MGLQSPVRSSFLLARAHGSPCSASGLSGRWFREVVLKRRDFLKSGVTAALVPMAARSAQSGSDAVERPAALAGARMIWCGQAVAVPMLSGGHAEGIASSSNGQGKDETADLHCVFAKEILLSGEPELAELYLFAFTRYRLYVNGNYAGRGPSRYQNERPEYDVRDVRKWLRAGRNTVVVLVHRDALTGRIMRHAPGLIAALRVVVKGERRLLSTDDSWMAMPELSFSPRAQAWASIEEHLDARKTQDWTQPDLTQGAWRRAVIVPAGDAISLFARSAPLQTETELRWADDSSAFPVDLAAGGAVTLRLHEIAQAFTTLELHADAGSELDVTYGLPEDQSSGSCSYIARAGTQTYMSGDTFAFDRLVLRLRSGRIRVTQAAACEVRYPFERAASFACSDAFLNRLWTICARSLEVLSEDSYVDCADRERVEWTDDSPPAFDCTRVMMRGPADADGTDHWGDARLLRGLLRRIALTQQPDGQLKAHSCSERFDIHAIMEDRSCDWVVQLREYFESTGDGELVHELRPVMGRLLDWYRKRRTERGLVLAREWEVWDNPLRYQVCEGAGLNAMYYRALRDAAALEKANGSFQDSATRLQSEAEQLRGDFNRLLWNPLERAYDGALFGPGSEVRPQMGQPFRGRIVDGRFGPTAQANLFALYSGIVPDERLSMVRSWVLQHLDEVREPMSHYYLFQMQYAMEDEEQDRAVLARLRSAWASQVASPWQLSWESLEDGGGSKAHVYGMHPGYFLTAYVLGARREGAVSEKMIRIEPRFSGLEWAKGTCVTEFGPVEMEWKRRADGGGEIHCQVPAHVTARLRLPASDAGSTLHVDGRAVDVKLTRGWLETMLAAGEHDIRF